MEELSKREGIPNTLFKDAVLDYYKAYLIPFPRDFSTIADICGRVYAVRSVQINSCLNILALYCRCLKVLVTTTTRENLLLSF